MAVCFHIIIDYSNNIWGAWYNPMAVQPWQHFEIAKKRVARIVFDDYVTRSKELFSRLKWPPLDSRIAYSKADLVYKSLYDFVPAYMRMLFTHQSNCLYSLRSET